MRTTAKDSIAAWKLFVDLARSGSLTASSIELGIDLSVASKLLRDLESELGVLLIDRTKRPISLTETGNRMLPKAKKFVADHRHLCDAIKKPKESGSFKTIRLGISLNRTRRDVLQIIREYQEIAPHVRVELVSGANPVDVIEGRVDAACVVWRPTEPLGLYVLDMGTCPNFMMASPEYLRARGVPERIEDLAGHTMLLRREQFYPTADKLYCGNETFDLHTQSHTLMRDGVLETMTSDESAEPRKPIEFTYGDTLTCAVDALEGRGIAVDLSCGLMQEELADGRLCPVLPGWHRAPWDKTIVVQAKNYANEDVGGFLRWYQKREMHAAHSRWSAIFENFGFDRPET